VVSYLSTGLAGYSVDPGISCGAHKLAQTLRVKKKNIINNVWLIYIYIEREEKKKTFKISKTIWVDILVA